MSILKAICLSLCVALQSSQSGPVSFDKAQWKDNSDRYKQCKQLLRQYDLLKLNKNRVLALLGKPDGISKAPSCEYYILLSTCLGTTSLALRYSGQKVTGYTIGSFSEWSPTLTNSEPITKWVVQSGHPAVNEELHDFCQRMAKQVEVPSYVEPKDSTALAALDRAFLVPVGQSAFDCQRWKNNPKLRASMLFGLYHQHLYKQSLEQIESLLGTPARVTHDQHVSRAYYEIPNNAYDKLEVQLTFMRNELDSVVLCAHDEQGLSPIVHGFWHKKNSTWADVASELNEYFGLVGMPVDTLCQIAGHPEDVPDCKDHSWCAGKIVLLYSADGTRVAQLRANTPKDGDPSTAWEAKDYYPNIERYYPANHSIGLCGLETDLVRPCQQFSPQDWKTKPELRQFILFDLVHRYPLIGMSHEDIQDLLGKANRFQTNRPSSSCSTDEVTRPDHRDPLTNDCVWYSVQSGSDNSTYFELAFENDVLVAYRLASEQSGAETQFPKTYSIGLHMYYDGRQ